MSEDKVLKTHYFNIPGTCSNLVVETDFIDNGDGPKEAFINQRIMIKGGDTKVSLDLYSLSLGPAELRKLADELESVKNSLVTLNDLRI